jgi:hypothetical protein
MTKRSSTTVKFGMASLLGAAGLVLAAQTPQLPPNYPRAQYDESKVPQYTLPDPLVLLNGKKVKNTKTWVKKRRPEILNLFATNVYGRNLIGRPPEMTWEVVSTGTKALDGASVVKTVTIYFAGKKDGPKMDLRITLPAHTAKPVPTFLVPEGFATATAERDAGIVAGHGYGFASFNPASIEADNQDGYTNSVRAYFAAQKHLQPGADTWGAIGAWAWGMSRAMDYLVTDAEVDGHRVAVMGFSRYGKVTMWAGSQDERFAIVFSGESGCGGATIVRRQYGETIKAITTNFPYWFDASFKTYADRVNDLPVDWHMMIALMAPRPVYIATAESDYWGDPRGSFLAAKAAEPVYKLFGKAGLGVEEMLPQVETPVGETIGYHNRKGGHGITEYDWKQFLAFADRHFGVAATGK